MALDLVSGYILPIIDILVMSIKVAVPAFLLVLAGQRLNKYIKEKLKASWIVSVFISTFALLVPIVFALYLLPYYSGYIGSPIAGMPAPDIMQMTFLDLAMAVISTILKNILSALLFAILLMPLVFFASFVEEKLREKLKVPAIANLFIAVFITALVSWLLILFVFPWIIDAVFWKLYWSEF